MNYLMILYMAIIPFIGKKPAENTEIFLESISKREIVAFQKTSEKGKAEFQYMEEGDYRLQVVFPQQEGKYLKNKRKTRTLTKASYDADSKTYYYQGIEGFFSVKFSGLKRIDSEDFYAVFRENRDENEIRIIIAQFQTRRDGAEISLSVNVLTAAQFKKATDKVGNDISMMSIPNMK